MKPPQQNRTDRQTPLLSGKLVYDCLTPCAEQYRSWNVHQEAQPCDILDQLLYTTNNHSIHMSIQLPNRVEVVMADQGTPSQSKRLNLFSFAFVYRQHI